MALRVDIGELRPPRRMADGRLVAEGLLTRAGVFTYRNPDGTQRRELRPPEEVFRRDALESFENCLVTDDHPPQLVNTKNAKQYAVGTVGDSVRRDEDHVRARLTVYDAATISKMEGGKVALSCGYEVDLDETPGEHPLWGRYDAVQRNIRGNHVALVETARAGDAARVRMDAAVMTKETPSMGSDNTLTLETAAQQIAAHKVRADNAEAELAKERKRADDAEGKAESYKAKAEGLEKARQDEDPAKLKEQIDGLAFKLKAAEARADAAESPERLRAAVRARVKIEGAAAMVLGERFDSETLTDREIMTVVVEKVQGFVVPKDRSDDYVRARFDAAMEGHKAGELALATLRAAAKEEEKPRMDALAARERYVNQIKNAWKGEQAK